MNVLATLVELYTERYFQFITIKNSALALHMDSLELAPAVLVKSQKFDRKIDFFEFFRKQVKVFCGKNIKGC
jgi:hypothetical protein